MAVSSFHLVDVVQSVETGRLEWASAFLRLFIFGDAKLRHLTSSIYGVMVIFLFSTSVFLVCLFLSSLLCISWRKLFNIWRTGDTVWGPSVIGDQHCNFVLNLIFFFSLCVQSLVRDFYFEKVSEIVRDKPKTGKTLKKQFVTLTASTPRYREKGKRTIATISSLTLLV